jgi:hypothetical protein
MPQHDDTNRIEDLISNLDALDEPRAAEAARALVQAVLELHRHGLRSLVETLRERDDGLALLEALARDEAVANLMLLHGLHPHDASIRIRRALDEIRTWLGARAVSIEVVSAEPERVCLRLAANGKGRKPRPDELRARIETIVYDHAPEVEAVEIEGLPLTEVQEVRFVRRRASAAPPSEPAVDG